MGSRMPDGIAGASPAGRLEAGGQLEGLCSDSKMDCADLAGHRRRSKEKEEGTGDHLGVENKMVHEREWA